MITKKFRKFDVIKKLKYDFYESHKKEHDFFVSKVEDVEEKLKSEKLVWPLEISVFLKDWLNKHIQISIKNITVFFISKGIK